MYEAPLPHAQDYVIRMEALASQQAQLAGSAERQAALRSAFIDLHGALLRLRALT